MTSRRWAALILAATLPQLVLGTFDTGLSQFDGKAFGARLVAYPVLMLAAPVTWCLVSRRRGSSTPMPWGGFALIMAPFLIDVTGNTLNLYDTVHHWDDLNHFVNWGLLCGGIGLLIVRGGTSSRWVLLALITGLGATLAICWELGEWLTYIRFRSNLGPEYTDTLGDEALGTLGAFVAALLVVSRLPGAGRRPRP